MQFLGHAGLWLGVLLLPAVALGQQGTHAEGKDPTTQPALPRAGDTAPDFELKAVDGKAHKLSDYKDKIVVLEWWNQDCPFCRGVSAEAKSLAERYQPKDVVWLAIDSTYNQTAEKDAKFAEEKKIPYPILMDSDGKVGQSYGAKTTPHVFIIKKGRIVYSGAFSTSPQESKDKTKYRGYVGETLLAVVSGLDVPTSYVEPWGCSVKYKK
jgi:peroxiredoxin